MKHKTRKEIHHFDEVMHDLGLDDGASLEVRSLKEAEFMAGEGSVEHTEGHTLPKCDGKLIFPTQTQCRRAIKNRLRKGGNASSLRAYDCEKCSGWHMTSAKRGGY